MRMPRSSATGTTWQVTALNGSLAPGQYFLIQESQGAGGTTNLPTPNATGNIAKYTYEQGGDGRLLEVSEGKGEEAKSSQTYTYDAANRLTGATRGTNTFSYAYNLAGNITSRTYPDGTVTTYGYDNDGRLSSATSGGVSTTYAYDAASNLTQTTLT